MAVVIQKKKKYVFSLKNNCGFFENTETMNLIVIKFFIS